MRNFSKQPFYRSPLNGGFVRTKSLMLNQKEPSLLSFKHYFHSWHCVKSVQIQSYFLSIFFCIRTEYGDLTNLKTKVTRKESMPNFPKKEYFLQPDTHTYVFTYVYALSVFSTNTEQYGPEITLYLDTFHAVSAVKIVLKTKKRRFLLGAT